jgi:uncharacterized Ntn-hydrolase superfamily protein
MTFSILAVMPETGELGGAVATRRVAVGSRIPMVKLGVGAVASQAVSNPWLAVISLDLLTSGISPQATLSAALATDPGPEKRQLHLIDAAGRSAAWTGEAAPDSKGHIQGAGFSVAGNHLAGPEVVPAVAAAFANSRADTLAYRLLEALEAGDAAGGDARGRQSAALVVFRDEPFPYVDLRVDDDPDSLQSLRRILDLYREERLVNPRPRSAYQKE